MRFSKISFVQKGARCALSFVLAFSMVPSTAFAYEAGGAPEGEEQHERLVLPESVGEEVFANENGELRGQEESLIETPMALEDVLQGTGTAEDPYLIASESDLISVRSAVNADKTNAYATACYLLTADIILTEDWEPIGKTQSYPFKGTFDGGKRTISGLRAVTSTGYCGLFGYVSQACISDVCVSGTIVAPSYVGGVVGYAKNSRLVGLVSACSITACRSGSGYFGYQFGGVVGGADNTQIIGCAFEGQITHGGPLSATNVGYGDVGGVCGYLNGGAVLNCYNKGSIKASLSKIGGIVGDINGIVEIDSCYNRGDLSHCSVDGSDYGNSYEGGIVGSVSNTSTLSTLKLNNCFNAGAITSQSAYDSNRHLGGIVGSMATGKVTQYPQAITNNYFLAGSASLAFEDAYSSSRCDAAGQGESVSEAMAKSEVFAQKLGGSFTPDFDTQNNDGYPYLRWESPDPTYDISIKVGLANDCNDHGDHPLAVALVDEQGNGVDLNQADEVTISSGAWIATGLADDATYTCIVEKEGYSSQRLQVELVRGGAMVSVQLQPQTYQAQLTVSPADAVVSVCKITGDNSTVVQEPRNVSYAEDNSSATYEYGGYYWGDQLSYDVSAYGYESASGDFASFGLSDISDQVALSSITRYSATFDVRIGKAAAAGRDQAIQALSAVEAKEKADCVIISSAVPSSIAGELRSAIAENLEAGIATPILLAYYRNPSDTLFNNKLVYDSRVAGQELALQGEDHYVGIAPGLICGDYAYVTYVPGYPTATGQFSVADDDCNVSVNIASLASDEWDGRSVDLGWYLSDPDATEFHLHTAADLAGLSALVGGAALDSNGVALKAQSFQGKTVYLDADLNLDGNAESGTNYWTPIGSYVVSGNTFKGTFDGQGHSISGLVTGACENQVRLHSSGTATGLFSAVYGSQDQPAALRNLVLVNPVIHTDKKNTTATGAGALVGNASWAVIENIRVEGGSVTHPKENVAGVLGLVVSDGNVTVRDCYNSATVSCGRYYAGGIVGKMSNPTTIERCINEGSVLAESSTYQTVVLYSIGGIVGNIPSGSKTSMVSQCANHGRVSGSVASVGGIVGSMGTSTSGSASCGYVVDCYNTGEVVNLSTNASTSAAGGINAGGIVGYMNAYKYVQTPYLVQSCYNAGFVGFGEQALPERHFAGGVIGQAAFANLQINGAVAKTFTVEDFCGLAPIGRNYTYDENLALDGIAVPISLEGARDAQYAQYLGGAWMADDLQNPQNNGMPVLRAFDKNARWDVAFNITLDTQANNDYKFDDQGAILSEGTLPRLQVFDAQGAEVSLEDLHAVISDNGQVSFVASCQIPNGTYVYQVSKQGYDETAYEVIDPETGEQQTVYDSLLTGTFMVNYSSLGQDIRLTATKYPYELEVVDFDDAQPILDASLVLTGEDGVAQSATYFDAESARWTYELYNGAYGVRITHYGHNTIVADAQETESALSVHYGGNQRSVRMHRSDKHQLTFTASPQEGAFQDSQVVLRLWSDVKDFGYQVVSADDLGVSELVATLADDTYHYQVRAGGFALVQGSFELKGQDQSVNVALEPLPAWDGSTVDVSWYNTNESVFYISSAAELAGLAAIVNGTAKTPEGASLAADTFEGKTVVLLSNVFLENREWAPIGTTDAYGGAVHVFAGTLDGNGHGVYGMKVTIGAHGNASASAFVAAAGSNATFKNLTVEGSVSGATKSIVHGAAGFVGVTDTGKGALTFENCSSHVAIDVAGTASSVNYAAGFVGWAKTAVDIFGCSNRGSIVLSGKDNTRVGGLLAFSNGSSARITASYSQASIDVSLQSNTTNSAVGGLVGTLGSESLFVENCYVTGQVKAYSGQDELLAVGAIAGQNTGGTARDSYIVRSYVLEGTASQAVGVNSFSGTDGSLMRTSGAMRDAAFVDEMNEGLEAATFVSSTAFPQLSWERTVTQVALETLPSKTSYNDQDRFDATGMSLRVSYSSGDDTIVTSGWFVSNGSCLKPGQAGVSVEYAGYVFDVPLSVTQVEHETISQIQLELAGPVEGATCQNQVNILSKVNTKYVPETYTAQVNWSKEGVVLSGGQVWQNNTYYRAEVQIDTHYVDGDAWYVLPERVEVTVTAADGTPMPLEVLYATRSADGRTFSLTCTYEALGRASNAIDSPLTHLYYKGDQRARQYNHALQVDPALTLTVEGETFEFSVEDIERGLLTGAYVPCQTSYSVLGEDGNVEVKAFAGVSLYQFLSSSIPARIADGTEIAVVSNDGVRVTTTMGDIRETARCYDPQLGESTVPALLAFACEGKPLISASALTDEEGPLMAVTGQPASTVEGLVQNVTKIEIDEVQSDGMQVVTFGATCVTDRLRTINVLITDCYGNQFPAENGRVALNDNETYSYKVSVDGYSTQVGSFTLEGEPLDIQAQLLRVYNGTPVAPQVNGEDGYYEIYQPEELVWWGLNGNSTDKVRLMSDVALNAGDTYDRDRCFSWPVETFGAKEDAAFCGTFDGNGHTIYGFYLCRENIIDLWLDWSGEVCMTSDNVSQLGLFGYTSGATITNLGIDGRIDVIDRPDSTLASWMQIGGMVGYAMRTTISNCTSNLSVNHVQAHGGGSLGGVSFDGWPQLQDVNIGGICGTAAASTTIESCYSRGTYYSAESRTTHVGGIAGQLRGYGSSPVLVKNCYSTSSWYVEPVGAAGYQSYVGGIVGKTYTMQEATTPQVIGCVALNRAIDGGSTSTTRGNRVVGDSGSVVVDNCAALTGMLPAQCVVDETAAGYGQDMSLAASTVQASYERLGWAVAEEGQLAGWQFVEDRLPLLAWQNAQGHQAPDQQLGNVSYTPGGNGDIAADFNEYAPPATFTVYAQVGDYKPRVARVFSSKELQGMAVTQTMKLSGYTSYSAYGRAVTQYIPLEDLVSAAGLPFGSGDAWVVAGLSYDFDTYVGTKRYYYPHWVEGNPDDAVEVPTSLVIKSFGGSGYTSDDLLDIAVFSADYLYAYMTTYGQATPYDANVSGWMYQQVEGTVFYDADHRGEAYVQELLLDVLTTGQNKLDQTLVGDSAAEIPAGFGFVAQEEHDALRDALAAARNVYNNSTATNGDLMAQVEVVESACSVFSQAVRTGSKGVDFNGLSTALDVALEYLDLVTNGDIAVSDGTGLDLGTRYVFASVYTRLAGAIENGQTMLGDAYTSQASVDNAEVLLTQVVQEFEDAIQVKVTPDAPATMVDLLKTIISTLSDAVFSGTAIEPDFVIYYDGRILDRGTDYSVTYYGNDKPGTAVAVIQGTGAFSGTVVKTFKIESGNEVSTQGKVFTLSEALMAEAAQTQGPSDGEATVAASGGSDGSEYVAGQLIVVYDNAEDGTFRLMSEDDVVKALSVEGVQVEDVLAESTEASGTVALVSFNDEEDAEAKAEEVAALPGVAYAQPNYVYRLTDKDISTNWVSDDPYTQVGDGSDKSVPNQYYLYGDVLNDEGKVVSRGANVLEAWDYSTCDGQVTIAVLDTGCNLVHEDLVDNLVTDLAYDTYHNQPLAVSGSFNGDYYGHGTHCCGIAAATANNGVGIAGASANAKVLPIKVFTDDTTNPGCYTSSLVSAYSYLFDLIDSGKLSNLHVINMSLGGYSGMDSAFKTQIEQAYNNYNIVTVAAGGNGDSAGEPYTKYSYPSDWDVCLAVTALDQMGRNCNWSDYNEMKDISAPGLYLWSTYITNESSYKIMSGTSMASPLVAGIVALCFAADSQATADQVVQAVKTTADPINDGEDKYQRWPDKTGSAGAINSAAAVRAMSAAHISIPEGQSSLYRTQTVQLKASISDLSESEAEGLHWNWSITPGTGTATITDDGLVTALTAGTVRVSVSTTYNERLYEAFCTLNVKEIELGNQLTATKSYSDDIALVWQAAPLANEYVIERRTTGAEEFERIAVLESPAVAQAGITYHDTTCDEAVLYTYRVTPQIRVDNGDVVVGKTSLEVQGARLSMVTQLASQTAIVQRHLVNNAIFGGSLDTVVIVGQDDSANSMMAAGYAGVSSAIVFTTGGQTLEADVSSAIGLLDPAHVVLFGDEDALSLDLENQLCEAAPSATITRKSGAPLGRAAELVYQAGKGYWGSTAFLMDGSGVMSDDMADLSALAVSYAYAAGSPVFFTINGKLSVTTRQNLAAGGFSNVVILGGSDVVSEEVETQLTRAGLTHERVVSRGAFASAARFSLQAVQEKASGMDGYVVGPLDTALSLQAAALARAMGATYISVENGNEDALAQVVTENSPKPLAFVERQGKALSQNEVQRVIDFVNTDTIIPETTETPELIDMSLVCVDSIPDQRYTGSAIEPDLSVTFNGKSLVLGIDYALSYSNNVDEGTAKAILVGKGAYAGRKTVEFTIGRPSMQAVDAAPVEQQHYTGKEVKPLVELTYQGEVLTRDLDYVLYYSNNIEVGTGIVICVGTGSFKDACIVEFQIVDSEVSDSDFRVDPDLYAAAHPYRLVTFTGSLEEGIVPYMQGETMVWTGSNYKALVALDKPLSKWDFKLVEGSAAQMPMLGDVNANGKVNVIDAQVAYDLVCGRYQGFDTLSQSQWLAADMNEDSLLEAADAFAIQYYVHSI